MNKHEQYFERAKNKIIKVWTKNKRDASEIAFHLEEIKSSLSSMQKDLEDMSEDNLISFLVEADLHFRWHLDNVSKLMNKSIHKKKWQKK